MLEQHLLVLLAGRLLLRGIVCPAHMPLLRPPPRPSPGASLFTNHELHMSSIGKPNHLCESKNLIIQWKDRDTLIA